ncbi:aldehyde dehydrogenase family protein [Streptomyces sp. NPDC003077]|uniref:aldehyde dehydrogenase family protein n=1 Tax=Streptomyces sp. NPDC003077 TaxID=3154443 RepID=UPI0033AA261C
MTSDPTRAAPGGTAAPGAAPRPADGPAGPDVAAVVAALRAARPGTGAPDLDRRIARLRALERFLAVHEADITRALVADLGRTAAEAWLGDIAPTRAEAAFARRHVRAWARRHRTPVPLWALPGRAWYQYEPLGTVLIIGPWNYPVFLLLGPLVSALAAGNSAVVKPSEHAPATSRLLADLLPRHLGADAVRVVEGGPEVTRDLLAQGFDHAFFTGGTETGGQIMAAAARHLTPVTLELGGKSPVIVTRRADVDVAARRVAWAKLVNAGQTCIAPDYALVDTAVREAFVSATVAALRAFRAGRDGTPLRVVDRRHFERLAAALAGAGGTVAAGGGTDPATLGIDPTVIVDPLPDSRLMTEEIFGPVLPVLGVDSLDAALRFVRSRPKPLALYLFSRSRHEHRRVLAETSSGGVVVNHVTLHGIVPHLPFGGVGPSGMGTSHGRWGFETFSHPRAVLTKPLRPDPSIGYPPYTGVKMRVLRGLLSGPGR